MDLSIIIVSYNGKQHLLKCLDSIFKFTSGINFEVIVVDNASQDGSADLVRKDFPQVKLYGLQNNLGFGKANNLGFKAASGEYILFLNDDTEIRANIFPGLIKHFGQAALNQHIGMLGCKLIYPDGKLQESVRRFPTWKDQLIVLTKLHNFFPNLVANYLCKDFDYNREQEVEQVMGSFMLSEKKILNQVGVFDPKFFCWFEEVDLQKRIIAAGFKIIYTPIASCIHLKGQTFGKNLALKNQLILNHSMRHYFFKHHPIWQGLLLTLFQPWSILFAGLVQLSIKFGYNVRTLKRGQN